MKPTMDVADMVLIAQEMELAYRKYVDSADLLTALEEAPGQFANAISGQRQMAHACAVIAQKAKALCGFSWLVEVEFAPGGSRWTYSAPHDSLVVGDLVSVTAAPRWLPTIATVVAVDTTLPDHLDPAKGVKPIRAKVQVVDL